MKKLFYFSLILLFFAITLSACSKNNEEENLALDISDDNEVLQEEEREKEEEEEDNRLDMQGYFLDVPDNYTCSGGFVDGYRYQDARCTHEQRNDYEILVNRGLAMSTINPEKGLVNNQLVVRASSLNANCQEHYPKNLHLDAEHYLCFHEEDGNPIITLGIGKSFDDYGRWFEADLVLVNDSSYNQDDYINTLENFLNQSIDIDWDYYRRE